MVSMSLYFVLLYQIGRGRIVIDHGFTFLAIRPTLLKLVPWVDIVSATRKARGSDCYPRHQIQSCRTMG